MYPRFLDFDLSEDAAGLRSWDAVASPAPRHNAAMLAEVRTLLAKIGHALGEGGPLELGHRWDWDLHIRDEADHAVALDACPLPTDRLTLALCLSGGDDLADCLSQAPGAD